jgi:hypothetical protein
MCLQEEAGPQAFYMDRAWTSRPIRIGAHLSPTRLEINASVHWELALELLLFQASELVRQAAVDMECPAFRTQPSTHSQW